MKQNENDQNHKKESTPVVDDKPNGKSQIKYLPCWFITMSYTPDMKYFYADKENKAVGPLPRAALDSLKATGIIFDLTMVIEEGAVEWKKFSDLPAAQKFTPPPPPPPIPSAGNPG